MRVFLFVFLLGLTACSRPADNTLLDYEKSLYHADSLANADTVNHAQAARLLTDLRREYNQVKEHSNGKPVRLMPSNGRERIFWGVLALAQAGVVICLIFMKVDGVKEKKHRHYVASLSENEQLLRNNERELAELEAYWEAMPMSDEMREEVMESVVLITDRNDLLHTENNFLRNRLLNFEKRPVPPELELLKERGERIRLLDEQVQTLTSILIDRDEVVESLHRSPKFLQDDNWEHLRQLTNRAYNDFNDRLIKRFPQLTTADLQLCLLMRLRFSTAQIATLIAVSPASVSQQKFRLKKRMTQTEETLFEDGETVEVLIWKC